jgi:hypothetical protein
MKFPLAPPPEPFEDSPNGGSPTPDVLPVVVPVPVPLPVLVPVPVVPPPPLLDLPPPLPQPGMAKISAIVMAIAIRRVRFLIFIPPSMLIEFCFIR